jgi:NAD+ diphosphatase
VRHIFIETRSNMTITSLPFLRFVNALKKHKKTCTVVEQSCGGLISASIMAQPGASSVFIGGSVAYNTQKGKPLLLGDDTNLHKTLMEILSGKDAEGYIQSKLEWTARSSMAFCQALGTDYAIAEGGATGPTFRPPDLTQGFSVIAIAGRDEKGAISVLQQRVIRSSHANREVNMRQFADAAAELATQVVASESKDQALASSSQFHNPPLESSNVSVRHLDRSSHLRSDPIALSNLETTAIYVILHGNDMLIKSDTELALLSQEQLQKLPGDKHISFLGIISDSQTPVFGVDLRDCSSDTVRELIQASDNGNGPRTSWINTRTGAPLLSPLENQLALYATALAQWQRRTSFCTACGGAVVFQDGGTSCRCKVCQAVTWPRQDPSMIAVISSRDGQKVLLAHSSRHPPKFHTVLAGFVEAGETLEDAVAREAYEETGIRIDTGSVRYVGSQPWPFPQSCMVGFMAVADCSQELKVDTKELITARWFDRSDVQSAAAIPGRTMERSVAEAAIERDPTVKLLIPPKGVIARTLLDKWLENDGFPG